MLVKTILNKIEKYSGFVYGDVSFEDHYDDETLGEQVLIVNIIERANGKPFCSGCGKKGNCYDHLPKRLFQFVPLWGMKVFFAYSMRRTDCSDCGVKVEMVPWAEGKKQITKSFEIFLALWAKRISWSEVARVFSTSWNTVFRAVETIVNYGLKHRDLTGVLSIGVDEISRLKGHVYATVVYQIDQCKKRLLWVSEGRDENSLNDFFVWFGKSKCNNLQNICSDMWRPFIKSIKEYAPQATHVLDRFHIMSHMNKAIDKIRAEEARQMQVDGYEPILKKTRFLLLKRPENLSKAQDVKLSEILQYNLKSVRAYLQKEDFQNFWEYISPSAASKFLDNWCNGVMRSRLEPMKVVARMLRNHHELIINWFKAKGEISQGIVEGLNNKAKVTARKAYGFRTFKVLEMALYHQLGDLPVPRSAHKFC